MSAIEALYIFDEHNNLILDHVYHDRPPAPSVLIPLYLKQPTPRPSVTYLPSFSPPIVLYSILQDNLLFLSPKTDDSDPLLVLEFLHRVADALQEFLGSPLLATKITAAYDVVAQVVAEMADGGLVCQGEANALRDVVETGPGVLKNLLGSLGASAPGIQGGPGSVSSTGLLLSSSSSAQSANQGPAIPWRRSNVRHTNNEMYVDLVESLSVTMAPSGRPLSAFAHGSIAFTSKVSGVPDLALTLTTGSKSGMGSKAEQLRRVMERVVFHPCVRLNRWQKDGVLSFVPPDGRFALCGYEVDLLGSDDAPFTIAGSNNSALNLPATLDVTTGLGPHGADFEVRVRPSSTGGTGSSAAAASLQSHLSSGSRPGGFRGAASIGDSKSPALEELAVHVPIPPAVRNLSDLRPTKGEAHFSPADGRVEWRIPSRDFGPSGAVLRCTVQGPLADEAAAALAEEEGVVNGLSAATYDYDEDVPASERLAGGSGRGKLSAGVNGSGGGMDQRKVERNRELMPSSATLNFSIKGWLASGLKVESLLVDTKKSRGLGPDVKPYKGVKYLTVSRDGVEIRC